LKKTRNEQAMSQYLSSF